jgi:acetyl/propionyl-CoA carboxylase alpha subunit
MFSKVLIANRGEIAVRIIEACRAAGIATVALYTDADRSWLARQRADEAVWVGLGPAAESYIHFDTVIDAAKRTGADAIHPGYGFLAENAEFARRCEQEGIVFIGPSADVIDLMGNKAQAKALVETLSIPTIPGYNHSDASADELLHAANTIGYPLMLKAVSGGGGMGIRIVNAAD